MFSVGAGELTAWPTLVTAFRQLSGVLLPVFVTELCSIICRLPGAFVKKSLIRSE